MITRPPSCSDCKDRLKVGPAVRPLQGLEQIGERAISEAGTPVMRTDYTHYQCPHCGDVWLYIEDSGFGGHGRYLHKLEIARSN